MDPLKVLVTGAGAPGIAGTIYSLKNNWDNREIEVIGVDMRSECVGKYLCDRFYRVPHGKDESFVPHLLEICEREEVDIILPQVTDELLNLAKNKKKFEEIGTKIAVSESKSLKIANNKLELLKFAKELGIPTPEFYVVCRKDELEEVAHRLSFPFVIKPPESSGMRGFRVVVEKISKEEFYKEKADSVKVSFSELQNILGDEFPALIAMEYLPGDEYTVDVLSSKTEIFTVIPRKREEIRTGITFVGTVEKREDLIENCRRLTSELQLEFAHGYQIKLDKDGIPKLIESNPRIQGTMVLSTIAGANIVYGAVKLALGEEIPKFEIKWGARILRYWGGIGLSEGRLLRI